MLILVISNKLCTHVQLVSLSVCRLTMFCATYLITLWLCLQVKITSGQGGLVCTHVPCMQVL